MLAGEGITAIHHSPQPKTLETARCLAEHLGVPLLPEPDLRETAMDVPWLGTPEFERRVGAYLAGEPDAAFEPYPEAQGRILACVRGIMARSPGPAVAIVSHGRILTTLFSGLCRQRFGAAEWSRLRLPDLVVADLDLGQVVAGPFAGHAVPDPWGPTGGVALPAAVSFVPNCGEGQDAGPRSAKARTTIDSQGVPLEH